MNKKVVYVKKTTKKRVKHRKRNTFMTKCKREDKLNERQRQKEPKKYRSKSK